MRPLRHLWLFAAVSAALLVSSARADEVEQEPDWQNAPSARYGRLDTASCHAALRERGIEFEVASPAPGVLAPVRIPKGVRGVTYRTQLPREQAKTSPWEIFDCRLVLALDDFAAILKSHHVTEVLIFSAWRPPPKSWPEGKLAHRHPGGLAVDVMRFVKKEPGAEGQPKKVTVLDVKKHFGGKIGSKSCGEGARAPRPKSPEALELRAIYCEAAGARLFTSMLSPNYDRAHHDHFHLEVTPGVKWRMIR